MSEMDWPAAKKHYQEHFIYKLAEARLSDEKLASLDAVNGVEGESKLSPEARERIILEITIRAMSYLRLEVAEARRDEAAKAITNIQSSSSLAEAKAKAIWHHKNIY